MVRKPRMPRSVTILARPLTENGYLFAHEHMRSIAFFAAVQSNFNALDDLADGIREEKGLPTKERGVGAASLLKISGDMQSAMLHCRLVDNYLTFLSETVAEIAKRRPEVFRTAESISIEEVLKHSTITDFVQMLAERKVETLSYQGTREMASFFAKRIGVDLFEEEEEKSVSLDVEHRNVVVHNRGLVSRAFLRRIKDYPRSLGEKVIIDLKTLRRTSDNLLIAALKLDERVSMKFDIERQIRYSSDDVEGYAFTYRIFWGLR